MALTVAWSYPPVADREVELLHLDIAQEEPGLDQSRMSINEEATFSLDRAWASSLTRSHQSVTVLDIKAGPRGKFGVEGGSPADEVVAVQRASGLVPAGGDLNILRDLPVRSTTRKDSAIQPVVARRVEIVSGLAGVGSAAQGPTPSMRSSLQDQP